MYVSGIDLSATATGVVNAHLPGTPRPSPPFRALLFGATGIEAMPAKLALATMDELVKQIVAAAIGGDIRTHGNLNPELVVIEKPIGGTTSSRGVFERGYMWFSVVRELQHAGIEVVPAMVGTLKMYLLGRGVGTKGAMVDGIARRLPMIETNGDDNLADAGAAAALAAELCGKPLAVMPAAHLRAVEQIRNAGQPKPTKRRAAR